MGGRETLVGSEWVARRAAAWVVRQRIRHRPLAEPLPTALASQLAPYFRPATLAPVRVRLLPRIDPPWPLDLFEAIGRPVLDFDRLWGLALVDTVLIAADLVGDDLAADVFHECVHVVQYVELGVVGFMRRYLSGWAEAGFRYRGIDLERDAFELQRRFSQGGSPFSVETAVARRLSERIVEPSPTKEHPE